MCFFCFVQYRKKKNDFVISEEFSLLTGKITFILFFQNGESSPNSLRRSAGVVSATKISDGKFQTINKGRIPALGNKMDAI